jgi:hypothetical protein
MEFASVLAGEAGEACVVKLGAHDESQDPPKQDPQNESQSRKKQTEPVNPESGDGSISDWA